MTPWGLMPWSTSATMQTLWLWGVALRYGITTHDILFFQIHPRQSGSQRLGDSFLVREKRRCLLSYELLMLRHLPSSMNNKHVQGCRKRLQETGMETGHGVLKYGNDGIGRKRWTRSGASRDR